MTNMKKAFLNKLLLATSSIGLLASMEISAADVVVRNGYISTTGNMGWVSNNGVQNVPANNDNIILTQGRQIINFDNNLNIGNINLYGYNNAEFRISDSNPTRVVSINNIVNVNNNQVQAAVQNALGMPHGYSGNNNAKVDIVINSYNNTGADLTITGNDISAVNSIQMVRGGAKLIFQNAVTVNAEIYSTVATRGAVVVNDDIIFKKSIGKD